MKPTKSKYRAVKTVVDGITFDSKRESARYKELKLLEKAGEIKDLKIQPKFELLPGFRKNGKLYRSTNYIADFSYFDVKKGTRIVEDVKGFETEVFKLKRKLFERQYLELELKVIK